MTVPHTVIVTVVLGLAVGCKDKAKTKPAGVTGGDVVEQSKQSAIGMICDPAGRPDFTHLPPSEAQEKTAEWLRERITNPEVIALMRSLADTNPAEIDDKIKRFAAAAGVTYCEPSGTRPSRITSRIDLPVIAMAKALEPLEADGLTMVITRSGLIVDGQTILALDDIVGETAGDRLPRLEAFVRALVQARGVIARITILAERGATSHVLFLAMNTLSKLGITRFDLAARGPEREGAIPLVVAGEDEPTLALVLRAGKVIATGKGPAVIIELDAEAKHARAARELARTVTAGAPSPRMVELAITRTDAPLQVLAELAAAVRVDDNGAPLFDEVALSLMLMGNSPQPDRALVK